MKKTILAVLMVAVVAIPCLAQEIEPDASFFFEGTRWRECGIDVLLRLGPHSSHDFQIGCSEDTYGYYEGNVYVCDLEGEDCSYCRNCKDIKIVNIQYDVLNYFLFILGYDVGFDVRLPSGFGFYIRSEWQIGMSYNPTVWSYSSGLWFKVDNDWSPYDQPIRCSYPDYCPDDMVCIDGYCVNE